MQHLRNSLPGIHARCSCCTLPCTWRSSWVLTQYSDPHTPTEAKVIHLRRIQRTFKSSYHSHAYNIIGITMELINNPLHAYNNKEISQQSCTHVFNNKGTNHQYESIPCDMVNTEALFHLWSFRNDSHCIGRTFRHHIPDFIKFASGKHFLQRYLVARTLPIPLASSAAFALSVATAHLEQANMMPEKLKSNHLDTPCHQALEHCRVDTSSHSGPVDSTSPASPHRAIPSMVTVFRVQDPTWESCWWK